MNSTNHKPLGISRPAYPGWSLALLSIAVTLVVFRSDSHELMPVDAERQRPNEWFFAQRAYPYGEINYVARDAAWEAYRRIVEDGVGRAEPAPWEFAGPLNIGGRISAMAMHPDDLQTIYAGAASGGIFKSTNLGQSWAPIFDFAPSLSIGDIAIAPSDPDILYTGTGEANAGGGSMSYDGFGVFRSDDAGTTWTDLGLENCGSFGRIAIHPQDPDIVYAAAMGRLFSTNPERGVFRTLDGGATWAKVLYLTDSTGAIDVAIHPLNPDTVYAAMWERTRRPNNRDYGGPSSGIYRSFDGGDNWTLLTTGLPPASNSIGRIGIDISASDPDVLYAIYADNIGYFAGVYKTTDGGDHWIQTNDDALADAYASYGWWFGRISIHPADPNTAYVIGFDLYKTTNGGQSWSDVSYYIHVDQHDLVSHPLNPQQLVLGNDGGVYVSQNGAQSWVFRDNMPITQFYTCETDEQYPGRLYGGTQDNGTNRTMTGGLGDWENIMGGDGFHVLVDPADNDYVYAEYQYGSLSRSTDGGNYFQYAMTGIGGSDRMNWNTPVVFDPTNPATLYYGSNKLYRSVNRAVSWQAISPDLTDGPNGLISYATITTISVSPLNPQYIYVGTDDGNVWRTENGGANWIEITEGLPQRWITRVAADPFDESVVYVTLSGYRYDSYQPHVFRSTDAGDNWMDISGDLPEAPVNDIIPDPTLDSALYIATDFGVFMTYNLGSAWTLLGQGLPNVPVVDLRLHQPSRKLIAATYGRSMHTFDLDQLVGIREHRPEASTELNIYPNPVTGQLRFSTGKPVKSWKIISSEGKAVASGICSSPQSEQCLDLPSLSPGIWFLVVRFGDEECSEKFIAW